MLRIQRVTHSGIELQICIQLFNEYAQELNVDLCFQSFETEIENPLKKYGPPSGCLLLAYWNHQPVGCVALTDITHTNTSHAPESNAIHTEKTCEMKRLFVQPAFRKHKIGDVLVQSIIEQAKALQYVVIKLDTLERLQPAVRLYLKHGFVVTNAYYKNPLPEVVYMQLNLK